MQKSAKSFTPLLIVCLFLVCARASYAQSGLNKVNHIVIIMQENHSFDNYFGVLPYMAGSPYHRPDNFQGCEPSDHACVDGLTCLPGFNGALWCFNSNLDDNGRRVFAFHEPTRCVIPDLDHSWFGAHQEDNFNYPKNTYGQSLENGFVRVNDKTEQVDNGVENHTEDQTIGYYTQADIPFYYDLAQKFAISDRQFSSLLGPTFPNRSYLMAATSFGHITTADELPPTGSTGYKPITGTIFDLLDRNNVTWADYFQDVPQGASFRVTGTSTSTGPAGLLPHYFPIQEFYAAAAAGTLPSVSFVNPNFGATGTTTENDEHPPTDIQRGQAWVAQAINAVRSGKSWNDTIVFLTYDENGGFFDHATPAPAPQNGALNPDGISPGQCEDLSNPPASEQPGGGAECSSNPMSKTDTSLNAAIQLCPELAANPSGPYPANCPNFNQLGFRVPLIAISPFSKPHYVSHVIGDHTSMLALIEKRFMPSNGGTRQHLTLRDQYANTLESMFDFNRAPSVNTVVGTALPPVNDCTPPGLPVSAP